MPLTLKSRFVGNVSIIHCDSKIVFGGTSTFATAEDHPASLRRPSPIAQASQYLRR
jgi:hypothetical protein